MSSRTSWTGPGRFFPLLPLVWHRHTFQAIRTADCTTYGPHEVRGPGAGPFGIYAGCYFIRTDPRREEGFTLAHVPTGRKLATLDLAGACKRLAEELALLRMGWHHTDPKRVTGPASAKVNAIVARHERDAVPRPERCPCRRRGASLKTASFTVRATTEQALRWNRAAEAEGHRSGGTWLACAADVYLKVRAKAGMPLPLAWRRFGRFRVVLMDGADVEVRGSISPPFGIFQGTAAGPDGNYLRTLVHVPTQRVIATLRSARQCRALAAELAVVLIRGDPLPSPGAVVERHEREAK